MMKSTSTLAALLISFLGASISPSVCALGTHHQHNNHPPISSSSTCSFCVSAFTSTTTHIRSRPRHRRLHHSHIPFRRHSNQYFRAHSSPPTPTTTTTTTTLSLSSSNSNPNSNPNSSPLSQLLHDNGFGDRLITLHSDALSTQPVFAETYEGGKWQLCVITGLIPPVPNKKKKKKKTAKSGIGQPKLEVTLIPLSSPDTSSHHSLTTKIIGIDQITTIWSPLANNLSLDDTIQSVLSVGIEGSIQQDFAINFCEQAMQKLYHDRTVRNNTSASSKGKKSAALTKKQIPKLAAQVDDSERAEELLRTAMKAGPGMHRLVDSLDALEILYSSKSGSPTTILQQRLISAEVLSSDARLGGRFKRMPCTFVGADIDISDNEDEDAVVQSITVMNGGWLAVDSGNRAGAEARKLVERSVANVDNNNKISSKDFSNRTTKTSSTLLTAADERIINRLECMAMGEEIDFDSAAGGSDNTRIEVDVREVLQTMKLPVSAIGARDTLIRMGRWTEQNTKSGNHNSVEPWPSNVMEAASSLVHFEKKRKEQLTQTAAKSKSGQSQLEGRTNLSAIPCICVDAKGTAFRDDAIGVRPRSSTGRKVTDASKWEILLHISDVSDIFSPDLGEYEVPYDADALREAAEKRGYSRYDLPLGPLHLMPPVALKALALEPAGEIASQEGGVNRCVTLWAYIDEKTGKLVDAGLERSITSAPIPFTYASATSLLDGNVPPDNMSAEIQKARSILALAERNLSLWSEHQRETNEAAARRHERMTARQIISDATIPLDAKRGASKKFQYSRGHRIVDSALDLYGYALTNLLKRAKAPIPNAPGQGNRRGRLGTAPLRRYVDAMAQRQALSVLCIYGGPPLTKKECNIVYQAAAKAGDAIKTVRSRKKDKSANSGGVVSQRQGTANHQKALQRLESHLARLAANSDSKKQVVRALSTGRENEVVLEGIGLTVKCSGVDGTLKPGEKVLVHIVKLDPVKGQLRVKLASRARSK